MPLVNAAEPRMHYAQCKWVVGIVSGNLGGNATQDFPLDSVASEVVSEAPRSGGIVCPGCEHALGHAT